MSTASEKVDLFLSKLGMSYSRAHLDPDITLVKNLTTGQSLIRLGDGDLDILLKDKNSEKIEPRKRPTHFPWLYDNMVNAIARATVIGIPISGYVIGQQARSKKKQDSWGARLNEHVRRANSDPKYISSNLFLHDLNLIPDLIKNKNILIIHCRASRISDKFQNDSKFKEFFNIYPNKTIGVDITPGYTLPEPVRCGKISPEVLYNERFEAVSRLGRDTLESIDYVLIGAGALGKPMTLDLNNIAPNAVSIDVGCILSLYSKLKDRGILYPHGLLGSLFKYF
jgi:hypothetical protein